MVKLITSKNNHAIDPAPYPRGFETQFERLLTTMTREASKQFRNQTLKKLNKGTIKKFDGSEFKDAQIGNYAVIFDKLSRQAKRKIRRRFNNKRVRNEVAKILRSVNSANQRAFYTNIEDQIGINMKQLIAEEGLNPQMNALILETQAWVEKELDDSLAYFANDTLRVMSGGASYTEVMDAYEEQSEKRLNNAKFIARNQISTFNGLSNNLRYRKLGIKQAEWITAGDERVRPAHKERDGKVYDLNVGLYSSKDGKTLFPGTDFNCRCIGRPIIPME